MLIVNNQKGSILIPSTLIQNDEHINTVYSDINNAQSKIQKNFYSIRHVKNSIGSNSYIFNWLNNCVQFNFDPYVIESSNNYEKNYCK